MGVRPTRRLVQQTEAVLLVIDGGTVITPFYPTEVHWLPNSVLTHHHLDVRAVHFQLYAKSRTLEGKTAVDADCFPQAILVGVYFVEARSR